MSHFYGDLQGSRGQATRCGTKNSGIGAHVRGWNFGVSVRLYHSADGEDVAVVALTGGSNGHRNYQTLGAFTREDLEYPPTVTQHEEGT